MSDTEGFLQRWSRRKLEKEPDEPRPVEADQAAVSAAESTNEQAAGPEQAEFDLSSLPSLDEIGPDTKVDVFLRKGVPADLSRAALRRAWVSDPAIRDFVGLSENSWDFNATHGVPGFGPLEMTDDLRRLVANMFTPAETPAAEVAVAQGVPPNETTGPAAGDASTGGSNPIVDCGSQDCESTQNEDVEVISNSAESNTGTESKSQQSKEENSPSGASSGYEDTTKLTRRGHGGAMPR
jgi:hypothetical protein